MSQIASLSLTILLCLFAVGGAALSSSGSEKERAARLLEEGQAANKNEQFNLALIKYEAARRIYEQMDDKAAQADRKSVV